MKLYLEDETSFFLERQSLLKDIELVIEKCLQVEEVSYDTEVSLTVVDKEDIKAINAEHRGKDCVTDVLSFPQIEADAATGIDWEELDENMHTNLDTNQLMLGDIVLCDAVAKEQAVEYNHSLEREVCFLVAHSMFHLLGYDHMDEAEEKVMIEKQKNVLNLLNIVR